MRNGRLSDTRTQAAKPLTGAWSDQPRSMPPNKLKAVAKAANLPNP